MTTISVQVPVRAPAPIAARVASEAFLAFLSWARAVAAQRAAGQLRSARLLEAAKVRIYAQRISSQDPRFAADLLAAADRHELMS
ncbi:MAG: hypothetical protein Q8K96_03740 [Rubrivivax sp.]|nr:hypothetical protein [Rubrivivax sp.]